MPPPRVTSHPINSRLIRINVTRRGAWLIHCIINVRRHVVPFNYLHTAPHRLLHSFFSRSPFHSSYPSTHPFRLLPLWIQRIRVPPPISIWTSPRESRPPRGQVKIIPGPSSISSRAAHLSRASLVAPRTARIPRFVSRIFSSTGIRNGRSWRADFWKRSIAPGMKFRANGRSLRDAVEWNFTIKIIAGRLGIVDGFIGRELDRSALEIKRG